MVNLASVDLKVTKADKVPKDHPVCLARLVHPVRWDVKVHKAH